MSELEIKKIQVVAFSLVLICVNLVRLQMSSHLPKLYQASGDLAAIGSSFVDALGILRVISLVAAIIFLFLAGLHITKGHNRGFYIFETTLWLVVIVLASVVP